MSSNYSSTTREDATEQRLGPSTYDLPGDEVFPEGIALCGEFGVFFVSGARSGDIFRGDLRTGTVEVFIPGQDREPLTTIGLDVDDDRRLWIAGGASGQLFVHDARSGALRKTFATPPADDTFINDVVSAPSGNVYATDSLRPLLFRVPAGAEEVEPWLELAGTEFESRAEGSDANGLVVTPDEAFLIVVKTGTGQLFRITTRSGQVAEIDLGGEALTGGDGLVLEGRELYVVRNSARSVDVVELGADLLSGRIARRLTDPSFEFPTTAAKVGDELLVVNSQFDVMGEGSPRLPFRVTRLRSS